MQATVKYFLDEAGQKASLIAGGDGKKEQTITIEVTNGHVDLFSIYDGKLSASCKDGTARTSYGAWKEHCFSTVPSPEDLLTFLSNLKAERAAVLAGEAQEKEAKAERDRIEAEAKRMTAIKKLADSLVAGELINPVYPSDTHLRIDGVLLSVSDADCGVSVNHMLAAATSARDSREHREKHLKTIKDIGRANIRPTELLANGEYQFEVPTSIGEDWAKQVQVVDASKPEGYAFQGPWLKTGTTAILPAGSLVLVGGKRWEGSRRSGEWNYRKQLFIVTPAGLRLICSNGEAKAKAIDYLALTPNQRVARIIGATGKTCFEKTAELTALNRTEYADSLTELDAAIASWRELLAACAKSAEPEAPEITIEAPKRAFNFEDEITDLTSASHAIITAGYKSLARKHKDSDVITSLLKCPSAAICAPPRAPHGATRRARSPRTCSPPRSTSRAWEIGRRARTALA
jgi:hypothetical protein